MILSCEFGIFSLSQQWPVALTSHTNIFAYSGSAHAGSSQHEHIVRITYYTAEYLITVSFYQS